MTHYTPAHALGQAESAAGENRPAGHTETDYTETAHIETAHTLSTASRVAHRYRPHLIERLKRQGFTQDEAEQWTPLGRDAFWTRNDLIKTACAFRDAGFDIVRARDWTALDVDVHEAHAYETAGWTPHDVDTLLVTLHHVRHPRRRHCPSRIECEADEHVWIETGIPSAHVPLYIQAGYSATAAVEIDIRRQQGDSSIVPALTVMAALRNRISGGTDVPLPADRAHAAAPGRCSPDA